MILALTYANTATVICLGIAVGLAIMFIGWIALSFYCEDCKDYKDSTPSEPMRFYDWARHGD